MLPRWASMLSIGAGAQQKVMAFIEQLGVRNLIIEAKEAQSGQDLQKIRKISPGLTFDDYRVIRQDVQEVDNSSVRKKFSPTKLIPQPQEEMPEVYGVEPSYLKIAALQVVAGKVFTPQQNDDADSVCVLGEAAKESLFASTNALGKYVRVDDQWFRVIGIAGPQLTTQSDVAGVSHQDLNNLIHVPVNSVIYRLADSYSYMRDEIDGIYLHLAMGGDIRSVAKVVRGILENSHHKAGNFTVIVPAELLAEQQRTEGFSVP